MSFEVILPFLKPIRHLLQAETVSEITSKLPCTFGMPQ